MRTSMTSTRSNVKAKVMELQKLRTLHFSTSRKASTGVQTSPNIDISRYSNGHTSVVREATVRRLGMLVVVHVSCIWPWLDPRSRSMSRSLWICENCTFLGLYPPPVSCGPQNWWLVVIVWDLVYSLSESSFRISLRKLSQEFKLCGMSVFHEIHISWGYGQMVGHAGHRYCACWCDLDPIQRQG